MKNRRIVHARQEVKIYEDYYKPSINPWRFAKNILGVLVFGRFSVAHTYASSKRRALK